jgi:hypothetical protein
MGSTQLSTEGFKFSLPEAAASELSSKCHWFSENGGLRRGRPTRHAGVIPNYLRNRQIPTSAHVQSVTGSQFTFRLVPRRIRRHVFSADIAEPLICLSIV